MRLVIPTVDFGDSGGHRLAPRPTSLEGKVIGYLDGWAHRREDGTETMYPLMTAMQDAFEHRQKVAGYRWVKKPSVSKPVPDQILGDFLRHIDVIINGEAA